LVASLSMSLSATCAAMFPWSQTEPGVAEAKRLVARAVAAGSWMRRVFEMKVEVQDEISYFPLLLAYM
jgi:hypothetical protein